MSSPSPYVEDTTARSIIVAMKRPGGETLGWIRSPPPAHFGCRRIRCRQVRRTRVLEPQSRQRRHQNAHDTLEAKRRIAEQVAKIKPYKPGKAA